MIVLMLLSEIIQIFSFGIIQNYLYYLIFLCEENFNLKKSEVLYIFTRTIYTT